MSYILDTHTLLWYIENDAKLSTAVKSTLENTEDPIFLSVVSLWEIAIKVNIAKLKISAPMDTLVAYLADQDISILPITPAHIARYTTLDLHHRDPFDRMIIVQAMEEELIVLGADEAFDLYDVKRVW